MYRLIAVLCFYSIFSVSGQDYEIPDVMIETLSPKGLRVSIPDEDGIQLFAFHGKINSPMKGREAGSFSEDIRAPENGRWTFFAKNARLKPGDKLYYWIHVNYDGIGYEKDGQPFAVTGKCETASTVSNGGKSTCLNNVIFQDKFEGTAINTMLWKVEHRIPTYSDPNSLFNSYENREETRFIKDNKLHLKPIAVTESEVRGTLNLRDGCTGTKEIECFYEQRSSFLLPPVKSSKIVSTTSFKYGKIEIRAKLPKGDWIFPIVQLEFAKNDIENPQNIWIAYSRGNTQLVLRDPTDIDIRGLSGVDVGGRLLLAGPMVDVEEPERSKRLFFKYGNRPFSDDYHTYGLLWTKDKMRFYVDTEEYGSVDLSTENFDQECVLSLGVGVGGLFDFPEGVLSGSYSKPWNNVDRNAIKRFFEQKPTWHQTWDEEKSCLIVDHVKVTAV